MAQWMGQFSGETHKTKIEDRKAQLRQAIEVYRSTAGEEERRSQEKKVIRFAENLHQARLKGAKAVWAAWDPCDTEGLGRMLRKMEVLEQQSIESVLKEFHVEDISWERTRDG